MKQSTLSLFKVVQFLQQICRWNSHKRLFRQQHFWLERRVEIAQWSTNFKHVPSACLDMQPLYMSGSKSGLFIQTTFCFLTLNHSIVYPTLDIDKANAIEYECNGRTVLFDRLTLFLMFCLLQYYVFTVKVVTETQISTTKR